MIDFARARTKSLLRAAGELTLGELLTVAYVLGARDVLISIEPKASRKRR